MRNPSMKNTSLSTRSNFSLSLYATILTLLVCTPAGYSAPFSVQGPGVGTNDFRITTFATNLNFPLGMARLTDGSLLVAVSDGTSFGSGVGKLVRLVDADQDGVADG